MQDKFSSPEWTSEEWHSAWSIGVGKVYRCTECANTVIVVRGGTGTLDPRCHGKTMKLVEKKK